MSQLKVNTIRHTGASSDAVTLAADGTCTAKITNNLSNRNLFDNGACRIGQRSSTSLSSGYGGVDRWVQFISSGGVTTTSKDTDVPTGQGFGNSIKLDVTTLLASGSSNWAWVGQYIEAQDVQSVCKGTSNAKQLTLQFWVKSPKTGTHTVRLECQDSSDGVGATYSVSAADTWEKKTVTFPASTSGAINNDTGRGIQVLWVLSAGTDYSSGTLNTTWASWTGVNAAPSQPNILDNTSNNFYLTGVQLEIGDVATDYEHRSYGDELLRAQRYYQKLISGTGKYFGTFTYAWTSGLLHTPIRHHIPMRAAATLEQVSVTDGYVFYSNNASDAIDAFEQFSWNHPEGGSLRANAGVVTTQGFAGQMYTANSTCYVAFSADL